jgi:phosphoribosylformimino-5-aminoimidazole carboxamide ribotide isomerase
MEIIPVIDLMKGKAVAGKSGKREEYKELKTVFADKPDPIEIARNLPYERLYVADLDGIVHGVPDINLLKKLAKEKKIMADIGIRTLEDFEKISKLVHEVVVGTETLRDVKTLENILRKDKDILLSIDIKDGKVISRFLPKEPNKALKFLEKKGVARFIILNISCVGTLRAQYINIKTNAEVYVGGGIGRKDLKKLRKMGIAGVLIGTALHQGLLK